jgi:molybdopterin converting factor small subunit
MARVWIPSLLRDMTGGLAEVNAPGATLREVLDSLERSYPGIRDRLCEGGRIRPSIAVVVDGATTRQGLRQALTDASEVHFVPAIAGG